MMLVLMKLPPDMTDNVFPGAMFSGLEGLQRGYRPERCPFLIGKSRKKSMGKTMYFRRGNTVFPDSSSQDLLSEKNHLSSHRIL
jgi:hypothetical protein